MLNLALKNHEEIIIDPREGLDPDIRVSDLFREGQVNYLDTSFYNAFLPHLDGL